MKSQRKKKLFAVEAFGGKCQICGYNKCVNSLTFHHIDSENKKESPSYIIMRWSWENAKKELEKCILICSNCHGEIHYKILDIDLKKFIKPWVNKTCLQCKRKFDTKNIEQIFCSETCKQIYSRKSERPIKEDLKDLIESKSFLEIGRMYKVSDNAIRKWCKSYGLHYRKRDIKIMPL